MVVYKHHSTSDNGAVAVQLALPAFCGHTVCPGSRIGALHQCRSDCSAVQIRAKEKREIRMDKKMRCAMAKEDRWEEKYRHGINTRVYQEPTAGGAVPWKIASTAADIPFGTLIRRLQIMALTMRDRGSKSRSRVPTTTTARG